MHSFIDLVVKKPVTVFMMVIAILIMGFISLSRLAVDFLPSLEIPMISIYTEYEGAGPEEVESSVTRIIEGAVSTVGNIKSVTSTSLEGRSYVRLEFEWGIDLDSITVDVREALDRVISALPDDIDSPVIYKFSTDDIPIMTVSLYGSDNLAALYDLADNTVSGKIEQVPGVARAVLEGGLESQVMVDISLNRLQAYGLSINDIVRILSIENKNVAGGNSYEGIYKYTLRTLGEFESIEDIQNVVVSIENSVPIKLRDVANVYEGYDTETSIVRVNGSPAVIMDINKEAGQNTVKVAAKIEEQLENLRLPQGVEYQIVFNSADEVNAAIGNVISVAWQGGLFAMIILLVYLSNFKTVGIIGISIPISIISTFILMYFSDITLNMVSLSGLTLGIGMMVDNSIVVLENIFYYRQMGKGKYSAAVKGTADVALAISASTFTTVAVFAPFLFVEGQTGEMFRDLCLTVVISMLASLFTALTIVPTLSARMISNGELVFFMKPVTKVTSGFLSKIDNFYTIILKKSMKNKKKVSIISLSIVAAIIAIGVTFIGKEGFPETDEGQFQAYVRMPVGTRMEQTDLFALRMEKDITLALGDKLDRIQTTVMSGGNSHRAGIRVQLIERDEGREDINVYVEEVRNIVENYPGKTGVYAVSHSMGGGQGGESGNISIEIVGDDLDRAQDIANKILESIEPIDGVRSARITREDANPELLIRINRDLASKMGINISTVAAAVETAFAGTDATRMTPKGSGTDIDVFVRLDDKDRLNIEDVQRMMIPTPFGMVPLSAIASIEKDFGPTAIDRKDNKRLLKISASTYGRAINDVIIDIQNKIDDEVYIPNDYFINYAGSYEDMKEAFGQLIQAFILAIVLVYAIMASQFESLIAPLVISLSLPFGMAGALIALFIGNETLSVYSGVGVIILVGIVINNGIVLIDYMNQLMLGKYGDKMKPNDAAIEAGPRRMRPVMMTSLTTIFGLLPMSLGIGSGSEFYKPLALSVLGGLSVATVFTLIIIPVVYSAIRNKIPLKDYDLKDEESKSEVFKGSMI